MSRSVVVRSLARSFTCLSLEVLSLINPYRNGVTALVSLLASHFLPPSLPPVSVPFLPVMVILPELVTPRSSSWHGEASYLRCVRENRAESRVLLLPKRMCSKGDVRCVRFSRGPSRTGEENSLAINLPRVHPPLPRPVFRIVSYRANTDLINIGVDGVEWRAGRNWSIKKK